MYSCYKFGAAMTWSQVIWKIQNRKRAQKKRKTDAKNRKRAQFEKVFELIIHFRVSRVFFPLPDTFWKSVRLRFFCGFFAFFLRIFCVFLPRDAAVRCVKACQCMTEPCPKNKNPAVLNLSPSTYDLHRCSRKGTALWDLTHMRRAGSCSIPSPSCTCNKR